MKKREKQKNKEEELTDKEKKVIEKAVKKLIEEHGDVLNKLADE
ncbi:MAG: hypothetical protein ACQEP3_03570 [Patescibacteria group bacterium]